MPSSLRSSLYFSGTKFATKLLAAIGDPLGQFESAPDLLSFAKTSKDTRVQRSLVGILISADHQICSEVMKSANWLSRPFAEKLYLGPSKYVPAVIHPFLDSIIALDGPDQRRIKKVMHTVFTAREVDKWKEASRRHVVELISEVRSEFDFVKSFANPLPLEVICEIIGVPLEYKEQCSQWGKTLGGIGLDLPKNNRELEELEKASLALTDLIGQLLQERKLNPKDDLLSVMAMAESEGEKLTDKEIIASSAFTLIAGFETTMNLLSVGMLELLSNQNQLQQLADDFSLIPNFIEEALRISSPIQFVVRTADSDQTLSDGTQAKKGQTIILNLAAANRDSKVFERPDEFDINRENARKNVSFGFGAHHCIGSLLARVEAEVLWTELFNEFPDVSSWKLTGNPIHRKAKLIRSLESLPMRF